jgi:hypothetical protein
MNIKSFQHSISVVKGLVIVIISLSVVSNVADGQTTLEKNRPVTDINPDQVDQDYKYQGEFVGKLFIGDRANNYGLHVIALGKGKFKAVRYSGGLPGAGFDGIERYEFSVEGRLDPCGSIDFIEGEEGVVRFLGEVHGDGVLTKSTFMVSDSEGQLLGKLNKVNRKSKTLGAKPPSRALVLFDGSNADEWVNGKISDSGYLQQGTTSKRKFGSHKLHIEFLLPYKPDARGQGRGNSGVYVQGRWEVQMLDSFGLTGEQNECGGLYSVAKPAVNMCLPPLVWQTFDIQFTAERYEAGEFKANARMTVFHNGVKIHDDVELPHRKTTAAPIDVDDTPGPVFLQNHGNPIRYRNIWILSQN